MLVADSLTPFAQVERDLAAATMQHLANAQGCWQGGPAFGLMLSIDRPSLPDFLGDAQASPAQPRISLCAANAPGLVQGSTGLTVNGQPCRITSPVVVDAGGWADCTIAYTATAEVQP